MDGNPSWSKFFSGCLVLLLLMGGGIGLFLHLRKHHEAQRAQLKSELFSPYWGAIQVGDFEKAATFWVTQKPDRLASAYKEVQAKEGKLVEAKIFNTQSTWAPGQRQNQIHVRTTLKFADGRTATVSYHAALTTAGWRISASAPSGPNPLGDGPY